MAYVDVETTAWVDPYLLQHPRDAFNLEERDLQDPSSTHGPGALYAKLKSMAKKRDDQSFRPAALLQSKEPLMLPISFGNDANSKTVPVCLTHVAVAHGVVVAVCNNLSLHVFDQSNDVPMSSLSLIGKTETGASLQEELLQRVTAVTGGGSGDPNDHRLFASEPEGYTVKPTDSVTNLFLDPMGRQIVVVFRSGISLHFYIQRCAQDENGSGGEESDMEVESLHDSDDDATRARKKRQIKEREKWKKGKGEIAGVFCTISTTKMGRGKAKGALRSTKNNAVLLLFPV